MDKDYIIEMISGDSSMIKILDVARGLNLPDWMISAGFVRNKVWSVLHGRKYDVGVRDVDLVYYDPGNVSEEYEKLIDAKLKKILDVNWSTKNQARMHVIHGGEQYQSSTDAISCYPEICTSVAATLEDGVVRLIAPHGVKDLVNLEVRICPRYRGSHESWLKRIEKKNWKSQWPKLNIVTDE